MTARQNGPGASRTREKTLMRSAALLSLGSLSIFILVFALTNFSFGLATSITTEVSVLATSVWFVFFMFYATFVTLRWRRTMDSTKPTS